MSKYLEIACRNIKSCRAMLREHGWSIYWVENPYMYLVLDFQSKTTDIRSSFRPHNTLLVYPESLAQLMLLDGDARDVLIKEFYREQCENLNR